MKNKRFYIVLLLVLIIGAVIVFGVIHCINYYNDKNLQEERARISKQYYDDKIAKYEEENKSAMDIDVVFIGDSLTDGYDLEKYYPEFTTLNRGIGGDTTTGVLNRLKVSVYDVQPKVTVLLIGGNNIYTMFDDYETILSGLKENLPNTKIVLLSLTAMSKDWAKKNEQAIINNQKIKSLAQKYNYRFVDLFTPLYDVARGEAYEGFTVDGAHFTDIGYRIITDTVTPVLKELLDK